MRRHFLILVLLPSVALADHPPSWLRLPAADEPRPKNFSTWFLEDSQVFTQTGATSVVYQHRWAAMPVTVAGIDHCQFEETFVAGQDDLISAKAWACSPDGRKCREFGGNEFVVYSPQVNSQVWDQQKAVRFDPAKYLEPGWIVACEVVIRRNLGMFDVRWDVDNRMPVRSCSLEIVPQPGGSVVWKALSGNVPAPTMGRASEALLWQFSNIDGVGRVVPEGIERTSIELGAYIRNASGQSGGNAAWADLVRRARAEMDPKFISSPAIEEKAAALAAAGSQWDRIRPLCRFVQHEVSYLEVIIQKDSMAGYRPHPATDVFECKYGDCKDKAVLLCTMLRAVGVEARIMLINSGIPRVNVPDWPSADFNHAIVAIKETDPAPAGWPRVASAGGNYVLFDPTNEQIPLGLLPVYDTGGLGLILAPDVDAPVEVSPARPAGENTTISISATLHANGSAQIEANENRIGMDASNAIQGDETESKATRTGELERRIQRHLPLISGLSWENSSDTAAGSWASKVSFSADFMGKRLAPATMYVATDLLSTVPVFDPWDKGSEGWLNVGPDATRRDIRLKIPVGWEIAELPKDWSFSNEAGEGSVRFHDENGVIVGESHLAIKGGVLDRNAYDALRQLARRVADAEHRPVILHKLATAPSPPAQPVSAPAAHST